MTYASFKRLERAVHLTLAHACTLLGAWLVVLVALTPEGCGTSTTTTYGGSGTAWVSTDTITDTSYTRRGNPVAFGCSLHDRPDLRALAVAQIEAVQDAKPWDTSPVALSVVLWPAGLGSYVSSVSGQVVEGGPTSFTDGNVVHLSYGHAPGFVVQDVSYELNNWRCSCEWGSDPRSKIMNDPP